MVRLEVRAARLLVPNGGAWRWEVGRTDKRERALTCGSSMVCDAWCTLQADAMSMPMHMPIAYAQVPCRRG